MILSKSFFIILFLSFLWSYWIWLYLSFLLSLMFSLCSKLLMNYCLSSSDFIIVLYFFNRICMFCSLWEGDFTYIFCLLLSFWGSLIELNLLREGSLYLNGLPGIILISFYTIFLNFEVWLFIANVFYIFGFVKKKSLLDIEEFLWTELILLTLFWLEYYKLMFEWLGLVWVSL